VIQVIQVRPLLDSWAARSWDDAFKEMWYLPNWYLVPNERERFSAAIRTMCLAHEVPANKKPHCEKNPSTFVQDKYAFQYTGPIGKSLHVLFAGCCPACKSVHWTPSDLLIQNHGESEYRDFASLQNGLTKNPLLFL
jgi:hypothetical protein